MMSGLKIVAVSGGLWSPSKTTSLARAISREVAERLGGEEELIEIGSFAAELGATLSAQEAPSRVARAIESIERADVLIAATPVFRGSFAGHFKHLFDLVGQESLVSVPVIAAATAGGEKHCLIVEHQLRPLFGFFRAFTVPTTVYATERDFESGVLTNPLVLARVQSAVSEVEQLVRSKSSSLVDVANPRAETVQRLEA